jgi:ectoine hydroxylase-related dioxygenase (phytanoyl-CoA dioxygenase family)
MPRVLTQHQLDDYHRDGFVGPIDCISPEAAAEFMRLIEAYEAGAGEDVSKSIRVRAVLAFKWLLDLSRHPRIAGALQDTIGPNVLLFLSGVWSKSSEGTKFVSWHQDGAYNPFDRNEGATAWIALTDSTPERGCIKVIPGSHKQNLIPHEETFDPENMLSRGQSVPGIDETKAVDLVLKAGQFTVHHEMVVHGSGANTSNDRRLGISFSCVSTEAKPVSGPDTGILIAGDNLPGHWRLNKEPAYDLDPVGMEELAMVRKAYYDPGQTRLATDG